MFNKILISFLVWRGGLFLVALLAVLVIPQFQNSFPYADTVLIPTQLPSWIWGFGNFDGVHYLRIAQNGYNAEFSQAFFPLFPLLVRMLVNLDIFIPKNPLLDTNIFVDPSFFYHGLILSNFIFLLALVFYYKLIKLDYSQTTTFHSLILLLAFPTAFYFGSVYTESIFLFLVLGTIYFIRKNHFLAAGIFSLLASATRILGLLLIPLMIMEIYLKVKNKEISQNSGELTKSIIAVLLAPFGTLLYMLYLRINFDDPLFFVTSQPFFGAERTGGSIVLLPQVIFRYLKMFLTVPVMSQPFFNAFLEFSFTIIILVCLFFFIKKIRISYFIFILGCLIVPTLTGTLSSMPRYSLMSFLLLPELTKAAKGYYRILLGLFIIGEIILLSLFIRGYWVA